MPVRSKRQWRLVRAARARGEKWAKKHEWFKGVNYAKLPEGRSSAVPRKKKLKRRVA